MNIVINNSQYFFKWTLGDLRRLEQLNGIVTKVCTSTDMSYKNVVALLWSGLYEYDYDGRTVHVFHQQVSQGFKAAQAMLDIVAEEHTGKYETQYFVVIAAYKSMIESGWFPEENTESPEETAEAPTAPPDQSVAQEPELFHISYYKGIKRLAYSILRLKPEELDRYTPTEVIEMLEAFQPEKPKFKPVDEPFTEEEIFEQVNIFKQWAGMPHET